MLAVQYGMGEEGLASRLILQVHDEVILEVPPDEESVATAIVLAAMEGAAELRVPLAVNLSWGSTWAAAKGAAPGAAEELAIDESFLAPDIE